MSDFWSDLLRESRESVPAVQEENTQQAMDSLSENYGIVISPIDSAELSSHGFQQLPTDACSHISGALQQIPGFAFGSSLQGKYQKAYVEAYRLLIPEGAENLSFMKNSKLFEEFGENAKDITLVDSGGTIRRKAGVEKIESPDIQAQKIAYAMFSIASIATNQYFLCRIDKKLESIQQVTAEIFHFLEQEKRSKLQGCLNYLTDSYSKLDSILTNAELKQATLNQVQEIKTHTLGDIDFYQKDAQSSLDVFAASLNKKFKRKKELDKFMNIIKMHISSYWLAIYVYQLASALEVTLTQNRQHDYLQKNVETILEHIRKYEKIYLQYLELYVDGAAYGNYGPKDITELDVDSRDSWFSEMQQAGAYETYANIVKKYQPLRHIRPQQLKELPYSIHMLDQMYNGPIELAISGEQAYIRFPDSQEGIFNAELKQDLNGG